jgi:hypothetical protein
VKVAVLALLVIGGNVEDLVACTHVFGGASPGGQFDPLLLTAFAPLALLAVLVFAYTAWRIEADRAWFRRRCAADGADRSGRRARRRALRGDLRMCQRAFSGEGRASDGSHGVVRRKEAS